MGHPTILPKPFILLAGLMAAACPPAASAQSTTAPAAAAATTLGGPSGIAGADEAPGFRIKAGQHLSEALRDFARQQGWHVIWALPQDWTAPADTTFAGRFVSASQAFIETLANNGVDLHGRYYEGNRTLIIFGSGGGAHE